VAAGGTAARAVGTPNGVRALAPTAAAPANRWRRLKSFMEGSPLVCVLSFWHGFSAQMFPRCALNASHFAMYPRQFFSASRNLSTPKYAACAGLRAYFTNSQKIPITAT
jgi:hypothetical protein